MSITGEIKKIESLLPCTMIRDRDYIYSRLAKLKMSLKREKELKKPPADIIAGLLARTLKSVHERERREANTPRVTYPEELPITGKKDEIIAAIKNNQVVIISGETGSGKSTQIPKMCLDAGMDGYIVKPVQKEKLIDAIKGIA